MQNIVITQNGDLKVCSAIQKNEIPIMLWIVKMKPIVIKWQFLTGDGITMRLKIDRRNDL